jgi:hypothetical protein
VIKPKGLQEIATPCLFSNIQIGGVLWQELLFL